MAVPIKYRRGSEVLASYNYVDVASGTGYVTFYGGAISSTAASGAYVLSNNAFHSQNINSVLLASLNGYAKLYDYDFDVQINSPRILYGDALITATLGFNPTDNNRNPTLYYIAKIRKYDGTTETEIASGTSKAWTKNPTTTATTYSKPTTTKVSITTPTLLKIGDTLRLTIEVYCSSDGGSNTYYGFGFDPKDRNDEGVVTNKVIEDDDTTQLIFLAPFKITT